MRQGGLRLRLRLRLDWDRNEARLPPAMLVPFPLLFPSPRNCSEARIVLGWIVLWGLGDVSGRAILDDWSTAGNLSPASSVFFFFFSFLFPLSFLLVPSSGGKERHLVLLISHIGQSTRSLRMGNRSRCSGRIAEWFTAFAVSWVKNERCAFSRMEDGNCLHGWSSRG